MPKVRFHCLSYLHLTFKFAEGVFIDLPSQGFGAPLSQAEILPVWVGPTTLAAPRVLDTGESPVLTMALTPEKVLFRKARDLLSDACKVKE